MKRSELPRIGDKIYLTFAMQPLPQQGRSTTALEMRVDLLKAQIQAKTEAQYNPTQLEYERRLAEAARLRAAYRH